MNLWDYYGWEAKKYGRGVNYVLKITNATSISNEKSSCKAKIIMYDDAFVCNIQLAVTTNLLAH